jgi:hypothetical protein
LLDLFDVLGDDLPRLVEDIREIGKMSHSYNCTFLVLIPMVDCLYIFDEFKPISVCNFRYKIISKVIVVRIKPLISNIISSKQFGFLKGRVIHEAIGTAQEGFHSVKASEILAVVIKLDLSKACDKVSCLYLKVLLIQIGFDIPMVK